MKIDRLDIRTPPAMADDNQQPGDGHSPLLRAPIPIDCTCSTDTQPPWKRPLLTQRKGYRQDGRLGRVRGSYVNGVLTDARDAGLALMERPGRDAPRDEAWQWGTQRSFGGGGNQRVGPGWAGDAAPRFDAGEVELVINGERCFELNGAWVTADGEPCCVAEEL